MREDRALLVRMIKSAVEFLEVRPLVYRLAVTYLGVKVEYNMWSKHTKGGRKKIDDLVNSIPKKDYAQCISDLRYGLMATIDRIKNDEDGDGVVNDCFGIDELQGMVICRECGEIELCREEIKEREVIKGAKKEEKEGEQITEEVVSRKTVEEAKKEMDKKTEKDEAITIDVSAFTSPFQENSIANWILGKLMDGKGYTREELRRMVEMKFKRSPERVEYVMRLGSVGFAVIEDKQGKLRAYGISQVLPLWKSEGND